MPVPFLLVLLSLAGLAAAYLVPGLSDLVLVAGPMLLASLFLLARALGTRTPPPAEPDRPFIVVDGSNVLYWRDNTPRIETVREVIHHLTTLGFAPGVVFDANAGHLVAGKYQHDHALGRQLGLPTDRVMVVPKGTPADPTIIMAARDLGARVVTNDRYRDWADQHPQVSQPGFLVRGGYRDGQLWIDFDSPAAPAEVQAPRPTASAR